jgi:hypothetical protein
MWLSSFFSAVKVIRADDGHEFQAEFHWRVEDLGMIHVYIKPSTPPVNGKVERSHLTDKQEFCQLLDYKGDVDLEDKNANNERTSTTLIAHILS